MDAILFLSCSLLLLPLLALIFIWRLDRPEKRVCVVVLGDIGRSPRMQYHALSFASHDWQVDFVGYGGSIPHSDVVNSANIKCYYMTEPLDAVRKLPRLGQYGVKVIWQSITLFVQLVSRKKPSHVLLQNPPALPTLAVLWFTCLLRGSRLVVDWHNYGYTILGLAQGKGHPLTRFAKWYERVFGCLAHAHICVTDAMKEDLRNNWRINATTMHDRPPRMFHTVDVDTQHRLMVKLSETYDAFCARESDIPGKQKERTCFTEVTSKGYVTKRASRPALLVSSTSWTGENRLRCPFSTEELHDDVHGYMDSMMKVFWRPRSGIDMGTFMAHSTWAASTSKLYAVGLPSQEILKRGMWAEDEDFSILLSALESYEEAKIKDRNSQLPDLVCAITGKGPQKAYYKGVLEGKTWCHVTVITPWLEPEDYPLLLGCADVGVCLHTSSSGLDLPMKVVDMFGCGLPVCAISFLCLPELVQHGHNGLVFKSSTELAHQLQSLLSGFPTRCEQLDTFRDNLKAFQSLRWQQAWDGAVLPLFSSLD